MYIEPSCTVRSMTDTPLTDQRLAEIRTASSPEDVRDLLAEIDRLRGEVDKLNSSDWKMDPWMQERFRKRAMQWGAACDVVYVARDRKDPYLDIDEMAEVLGLDEGESAEDGS